MDYRINRLSPYGESKQYHLFGQDDRLLLVADHNSPWLTGLPGSHVRFGRATGDVVASMDLKVPMRTKNGRQHTAYAIVKDHAVFAIINKHVIPERTPYYVVEVDGILWLALSSNDEPKHYAIYNEVPSDLLVYDEPSQSDLPNPIGSIYHDIGDYDYQIVMPPTRPQNPALVALSLTFLIDLE
ncbi:MAG: hypothetical protein AAF490_28980 [Chloroflexota bacterium]